MSSALESSTDALSDGAPAKLDVEGVRAQFPILTRTVHGRPLVYLDSAASAQKPEAVINAVSDLYRSSYSNVHRGVHGLAEEATAAFEGARERVARWIGAPEVAEVVFVRGATEGINLVAASWLRPRLGEGDEVLVTHLEHHSNIVPWQLVCEEKGARLVVAPVNDRGEVMQEEYRALLSDRTRLVALGHVSNALGTVNPVRRMVAAAKEREIPVLVDGAQALPHAAVDVADLGCDFYVFSGHKVFGPTGIGVLWGRGDRLAAMPPYQGGGEMIRSVTFERSSYREAPARFEAGTPNLAGAVGLAAALDFLEGLGMETIHAHESALLERAHEVLGAIEGLRIVGTARDKAAVVSFVIDGIHAHDIGTILDREGIAIRAGHHCAQPLMERFGVAATARASFALYNTVEEIDRLGESIESVRRVFA